MRYFQITASTVQWLTTAFMLVNAIMIPLTALLLEKVSTMGMYGLVICFAPAIGATLAGLIICSIY
jgi:MFS family permease